MFESISLESTSGHGEAIDAGFLAECLIFYKLVVVSGNRLVLESLLRTIGPTYLLELLRSPNFEYHFKVEQSGVATSQKNGRQYHSLVKMSAADRTWQDEAAKSFTEAVRESKLTSKVDKFVSLIRKGDLKHFNLQDVQDSLGNARYVQGAVIAVIEADAPRYLLSADPRVRIFKEPDGLVLESNLNFQRLNAEYHRSVPPSHSTLTEASFLAAVLGAQESLALAATLGTELGENRVTTAIHNLNLSELIQRRTHSRRQFDALIEVTLNDARAIRDAVNSGDVNFGDILKLLEKADRFKDWLGQQSPDAELLKAYYASITQGTWMESLPVRVARWALFTGAGIAFDATVGGMAGTVAGAALGTADSFLADRLTRGWKPHHFIESKLKPIIHDSARLHS